MRRRIALGLVVALAAAAVPLIGQSPTARVSGDPVFEVGRDGKATRFTRHNNYYPRVKSTT